GLSFEVDPAKLRSPDDWKAFFEKKSIGYVVRSPNYPSVIAGPLEEMEKAGDLARIAQEEVQSFQGMRVNQVKTTIPVVIIKGHSLRPILLQSIPFAEFDLYGG